MIKKGEPISRLGYEEYEQPKGTVGANLSANRAAKVGIFFGKQKRYKKIALAIKGDNEGKGGVGRDRTADT